MIWTPSSMVPPPAPASGRTLVKVMQDLTVYLVEPSEAELDMLLDLYDLICPAGRKVMYFIPELLHWTPLSSPILTASGRVASAEGVRRPYLEPARRRIREGRAFDVQIWDNRPISAAEGSWSLNLRRIHLKERGMFAFARFLVPLNTDPRILQQAAAQIAGHVRLNSGHGGLTFAYDPLRKETAFDYIYAYSRRFWGIDVEDLNATLPLMADAIKGVNWLTLVGTSLDPDRRAVAEIESANVTVTECEHATLVIAGPEPVAGDQNRPNLSLAPYEQVAHALGDLFPSEHPDFSGERFRDNANTLNWVRRFLEPEDWHP